MQAENHHLQAKAHNAVKLALKHGKLIRPNICERCGITCSKTLQAHHTDYAKPLDIIWICHKCHRAEHPEVWYHLHSLDTPSPQMQKALDYFALYPHQIKTSSRDLQPIIGVSHMTIFRAQQELLSVEVDA